MLGQGCEGDDILPPAPSPPPPQLEGSPPIPPKTYPPVPSIHPPPPSKPTSPQEDRPHLAGARSPQRPLLSCQSLPFDHPYSFTQRVLTLIADQSVQSKSIDIEIDDNYRHDHHHEDQDQDHMEISWCVGGAPY